MGLPENAASAYRRFIGAWEDADEELQPWVEEARDRVRQLSDSERRPITGPFAGFRQFLTKLDRPSVRKVAIAYPVAAYVARSVTDQLSFRLPDLIRPARNVAGPDSGSGLEVLPGQLG